MENNFNIEDLFKNTLENAEAAPPAGAWEAIQAKMGVTAASSAAAGTAATGLGITKIAAIVVTALGVGLGVGYIAFKDKKPTEQSLEQNNDITGDLYDTAVPGLPNNLEITEVSSTHTADKVVEEIKLTKKDGSSKTLHMKISQPAETPGNKNGSVVNQWLSPDKDKINRQEMLKRIMSELEKDDNAETVADNTSTGQQKTNAVTPDKEKKEEMEVRASIISVVSNEDPFTVSFRNGTPASRYEWDFGDGTTSKEEKPVHTYDSPAYYPVTVRVYDKAGKMYVFKDGIYIGMNNETTTDVSSEGQNVQDASVLIKQPNIFTPNGDRQNDEFYFTGKNIESFFVQVLDQSGRIVFTSTDINQHWNGNDRAGNPVPVGWYRCVYKAMGNDKQKHEGNYLIQIKR